MNDLKQFDQLAADITLFVAPTMEIQVVDPGTAHAAIEVTKDVASYLKRVDAKRKELVGPLNDQVKAINEYCKQITAPLTDADAHLRGQLTDFARKQEVIRLSEQERLRLEQEEIERQARAEREREADALRIRQEAEAEERAAAAHKYGVDDGDIDKFNDELAAKQEREWAEQKAEQDRLAAVRAGQMQRQRQDANDVQMKGVRKTRKVRIADLSKVPQAFLIITLNDKMALAAEKGGQVIPGLEFYDDMSVAIGATTRMPRLG